MASERLYPIGMQCFDEIIRRGMAYVDKTQFVYDMAFRGKFYFLARPRRFGKTLLISTMEAYFTGQKELFKGLALEKLEQNWTVHPVLRFDMQIAKVPSMRELRIALDHMVSHYEKIYGRNPKTPDDALSVRMKELIENAHAQTGQAVVVLIDEYDSPLLSVMDDQPLMAEMRTLLREFYHPVKYMDKHLRFVFLTGITKFSQLSIFSELNNLQIISMEDRYAPICGISKEELLTQFKEDIVEMGVANGWSEQETIELLKRRYDGYHFSRNCPDMFNPFSVLRALDTKEPGNNWFQSGTPTYLAKQIAKYAESDLDPESMDKGFLAQSYRFDMPVEKASDLIPSLYQSGYLTIKDYDRETGDYLLAYPNEEVRLGFVNCLVPYYWGNVNSDATIRTLGQLLKQHDVDGALKQLRAFLSSIPYPATTLDEPFYRTVVYLISRLLTPYVISAEQASAAGRSDVVIEIKDAVFCFEFKMRGKPETALKQIDDKGYLIPYSANGKQLYKVGVVFDGKKRTLGRWKIIHNA